MIGEHLFGGFIGKAQEHFTNDFINDLAIDSFSLAGEDNAFDFFFSQFDRDNDDQDTDACNTGPNPTEEYVPISPILSVSDVGFFSGWDDATEGLRSLPSIPFVPDATFAGGNDDIVLNNIQIGTRANQLLSDHPFPLSLVTLNGVTLPAAAFYQQPTQSLESVEQFRNFLANDEEAALIEQEESITENARRFTDADFATDVWFERTIAKGVIAYNPLFVLKKVGVRDLHMLEDELDGQFRVKPSHYFLDLRYMDSQKPLNRAEIDSVNFPYSTNTQYGVGSVVILEMGRDQVMRPVAIRIVMTQDDGSQAKQIFVRGECTDSAWIMSLLAAACSYTQTGVGLSHIYGYHVNAAAFQQQFYNALSGNHTIMKMLRPMGKMTMQFNTAVLMNTWAPLSLMPYYNHALSQFETVLKGWSSLASQFPYYKNLPSIILKEHKIHAADFTNEEPWDLYPAIGFQLKCEHAARRFVSAFVHHLYPNNKAVQRDVQLQAFYKAMKDPSGGNMKPGLTHKLHSVHDVKAFLLPYVYSVVVHGSARMRRYILAGTVVPNDIASFMSADIVQDGSPNREYSLSDMLKSLPDTSVLFEQYKFSTFFQATDNFGGFVDAPSPYDCDEYNEIFAELQEDVISIFEEGYYEGFDEVSDTISRWPLNQEA